MFSQDSENREFKELQSINKLICLKLNLRPSKIVIQSSRVSVKHF